MIPFRPSQLGSPLEPDYLLQCLSPQPVVSAASAVRVCAGGGPVWCLQRTLDAIRRDDAQVRSWTRSPSPPGPVGDRRDDTR
jgi:hypothetical protein